MTDRTIRAIALLLALDLPGTAAAQAVDCGSPADRVERTICSDRALIAGDRAAAAALTSLRQGDAMAYRRESDAQGRWKSYLLACGTDRACIQRRLDARRLELEATARTAPTLQVPRPAQPRGTGQLATPSADGDAQIRIEVEPDGTILRIRPDGTGQWYNPVTGTAGTILQNGTRAALRIEIGDSEAPELPGDDSAWSAYLLDRADAVAQNVLTPEQLGYLDANAPAKQLARLDYTLDFVAFITGGNF